MRDGRQQATQSDLEESIEVVIAGYQKKNAILTDQEGGNLVFDLLPGHQVAVALLHLHGVPQGAGATTSGSRH